MKCIVGVSVSLEDLFSHATINLGKQSSLISVNLYAVIAKKLLDDIALYGLYEIFPDAIDKVTNAVNDEDMIDDFVAYVKVQVMDDIKNHKLNIIDCHVHKYNSLVVTVDINFTKLWMQFKENRK